MADPPFEELSRRERQVMEVVFAEGEVSVGDVLERLSDPPSYSSVRTTLRILEEKGHVVHEQDGPRYVYRPSMSLEAAREGALKSLVRTFFRGSVEEAAVTLLGLGAGELTEEGLERLRERVDEARREGR